MFRSDPEMRKNRLLIQKFFFLLLFSFNLIVFSMNPITSVLAGDIDEVDGFQNGPNYRWRNLTVTGSAIDEYMEGDFLFINNSNLSGETQNYTKVRRLNDRDMYFNSRILLDVGGKFNGSEWWLYDESDLVDYNEGDLDTYSGDEFLHSYDYYDGAGVIETNATLIDLNLTALYHLDEGTGTNVIDLSNSTNQHNGTIASDEWAIPALFGNGSLANDFPSPDSWLISDHADFNFQNKSFTIELWFNKTSDTDSGGIIVKAGIFDREWALDVTSGEALRFRIYDSDNDYIGRSTSGGAINVNSYSHIAVVYQGGMTNSNCSIYVNGTQVDTSDFSSGTFNGMPDTNENIYVGGEFQSPGGFSVGIIDEVRIWKSRLTQSEITDSYNGAPSSLPTRSTFSPQGIYEIESSELVDEQLVYRYLEMEFQLISEDNGNITSIELYDPDVPTEWYYNDTTIRTNGTNEVLQVDLGEQNNGYWLDPGSNNAIRIRFATTLDPIIIAINYTFVGNFPYYSDNNTIGDYNAEEGFKFFLANEEDNRTIEWEITHDSTLNSSANYSLRINIYNASGYPVLTSNETFEYHYTTHGWLDFDIEFNIDTKRVRFRLEDTLGNRIVDYREIGEIYTVEQLITEFEYGWAYGKPVFGFNATTPHMAKVWAVIDYIDSNYDLMDWIEPTSQINLGINTEPSDDDSFFTSANQWSVIAIGKEFDGVDDSYKKYYHDIDHFDSVSFDFELNVSGLESADYGIFRCFIHNVKHDGSIENVLRIDIQHDGGVSGYGKPNADIYKSNDGTTWSKVYDFDFAVDNPSVDMAFELFYDDENKLIYQSNIHSRAETQFSNLKLIPSDSNEPFTKEMIVVFEYALETDETNFNDDELFFRVTGYDVTRKGIIGDIITGFMKAVFGFLGWLLTPIIVTLAFIAGIIVKAILTLGKFLEPLFNVLGSILEGLGSILEFIGEAIIEIGIDVGTFLLSILDDFIEDAIAILITFTTELVNLLAYLVFTFWDNFIYGPDLLAIMEIVLLDFLFPILFGIPQFLLDLIVIIFAIGNLVLLGFWIYALFLGFASQKFDPFAGISEFIERMLKGPDIVLLGFGPFRVPIGLMVVLPLSLFIILLPTGSMLIFW